MYISQRCIDCHCPNRFIHSKNRQHTGFYMAINHLADRTEKELKVLRGRRTTTHGYNGGLPYKPDMSTINDVPDTIDWNLRGKK